LAPSAGEGVRLSGAVSFMDWADDYKRFVYVRAVTRRGQGRFRTTLQDGYCSIGPNRRAACTITGKVTYSFSTA
jgi:hypothetical protein